MYWKGEGGPVGVLLNSRDGKQSCWKLSSPWGCDGQRGQTGGWRKSMWGSGSRNRLEVRQVLWAGFLMAMSVNKRSLNWLWTWAGGRWSCRSTGVMWRVEGVRVMIQAAEFWTSWHLWRICERGWKGATVVQVTRLWTRMTAWGGGDGRQISSCRWNPLTWRSLQRLPDVLQGAGEDGWKVGDMMMTSVLQCMILHYVLHWYFHTPYLGFQAEVTLKVCNYILTSIQYNNCWIRPTSRMGIYCQATVTYQILSEIPTVTIFYTFRVYFHSPPNGILGYSSKNRASWQRQTTLPRMKLCGIQLFPVKSAMSNAICSKVCPIAKSSRVKWSSGEQKQCKSRRRWEKLWLENRELWDISSLPSY